jgi:hypothetical protein
MTGSEVPKSADFQADGQTDRRVAAARAAQEANYHQARVLILINEMAGKSGSLDGLTKLAKLDFLLRYPVFLEELARQGVIANLELPEETRPSAEERNAVESRMIRYKYGPWDDRYYGIIGQLVGRGLAEYVPSRGRVALRPTEGGRAVARALATDPA